MKKVTQEMFDAFEVIYGVKQCPSGDYSAIRRFNERCSFGERCSFENGHKAVDCIQPFYKFSGFSSRQMSETYIFNSMDGIFVRCGCFFGSVDDFKNRVIKEKGEDNGYLKIVDLYVNEIKKR